MASVSSKYTLRIDLPLEYSSFQSVTGKKNPLPEDMQCIYNEAPKSLDFWCNGSIYPPDPLTNSPPPFFKPTCFLRYVGDGYNGLLGYCIRLTQCNINSTMLGHQIQGMQCVINDHNTLIGSLSSNLQASQIEVVELKSSLEAINILSENLKQQIHALKKTPLGLRTRKRSLKPIESSLQKDICLNSYLA